MKKPTYVKMALILEFHIELIQDFLYFFLFCFFYTQCSMVYVSGLMKACSLRYHRPLVIFAVAFLVLLWLISQGWYTVQKYHTNYQPIVLGEVILVENAGTLFFCIE